MGNYCTVVNYNLNIYIRYITYKSDLEVCKYIIMAYECHSQCCGYNCIMSYICKYIINTFVSMY